MRLLSPNQPKILKHSMPKLPKHKHGIVLEGLAIDKDYIQSLVCECFTHNSVFNTVCVLSFSDVLKDNGSPLRKHFLYQKKHQ